MRPSPSKLLKPFGHFFARFSHVSVTRAEPPYNARRTVGSRESDSSNSPCSHRGGRPLTPPGLGSRAGDEGVGGIGANFRSPPRSPQTLHLRGTREAKVGACCLLEPTLVQPPLAAFGGGGGVAHNRLCCLVLSRAPQEKFNADATEMFVVLRWVPRREVMFLFFWRASGNIA